MENTLFIFDMGFVLLDNVDFREKWIEKLGVDRQEFIREYDSYLYPIMDGRLDYKQFDRHIEQFFDIKVEGDPWYDFFEPKLNPYIVDLINRLKAKGYRVVSGTNNCVPHWRYITEKGWDKIFDACYASHLMGLSKPSSAYYKAILKAEGFSANNAMMIDDSLYNLEGAAKCGLQTFFLPQGYDRSQIFKDFEKYL
ncbi:MAG: HAD-IA family hydrolase [Sphaerochaetaceae bacterium]|nr:HAD-IA family hydrolase [Sphaerochaetaceae bacterium]